MKSDGPEVRGQGWEVRGRKEVQGEQIGESRRSASGGMCWVLLLLRSGPCVGTDNSVHPFPWQSLTCTHHTLYRAGIGGTEINELVLVLNKLCDEYILRWREGITLPARSPGQRSLREGFWKAVECEMSDTHPSGALLDWSCHSCPLKCVVQQGGGRERGSVGLDPVPG